MKKIIHVVQNNAEDLELVLNNDTRFSDARIITIYPKLDKIVAWVEVNALQKAQRS